MSTLLVAAILGGSLPAELPVEPAPNSVTQSTTQPIAQSSQQVADSLAGTLQTGTLLFSEGDCLAVRVFSRGSFTHVAAVVMEDGQPFVFDSMNGVGVRRQPLVAYLAAECPGEICVAHPRKPFSNQQAHDFRAHLQHELGRPYGIRHHLTGKRAEGVHCAEYVTDALQACEILRAKEPPRVSPSSLAEGLFPTRLYTAPQVVVLTAAPAALPANSGWCERLWFDTKLCTVQWGVQFKRWFLCK